MSDQEATHGVVTHSSGNHAQALALAARNRGIPAYIVMPTTTPDIKKAAVLGFGANIIECEPIQAVREKTVSLRTEMVVLNSAKPSYSTIDFVGGGSQIKDKCYPDSPLQ